MKISAKAKAIAERTKDAYSADRYSSWPACAQVCLNLGNDERQTEAILRSKWTRWARDMADNDKPTAYDLARYLADITRADVEQLTAETFASESEPVGAVEGEKGK